MHGTTVLRQSEMMGIFPLNELAAASPSGVVNALPRFERRKPGREDTPSPPRGTVFISDSDLVAQNPSIKGVSNSPPGLVFLGAIRLLLVQNIQAMDAPNVKSCSESSKGLSAKALPV